MDGKIFLIDSINIKKYVLENYKIQINKYTHNYSSLLKKQLGALTD